MNTEAHVRSDIANASRRETVWAERLQEAEHQLNKARLDRETAEETLSEMKAR